MTTPTGAITIADVAAEFGGGANRKLKDYYGVAAGVPAAGAIRLDDLRGKSAHTWSWDGTTSGWDKTRNPDDYFTNDTLSVANGRLVLDTNTGGMLKEDNRQNSTLTIHMPIATVNFDWINSITTTINASVERGAHDPQVYHEIRVEVVFWRSGLNNWWQLAYDTLGTDTTMTGILNDTRTFNTGNGEGTEVEVVVRAQIYNHYDTPGYIIDTGLQETAYFDDFWVDLVLA